MKPFRKITVDLLPEQANALLAFIGSVGRSDVHQLNDQGAEIAVQPAMEAIVALSQALKGRSGR